MKTFNKAALVTGGGTGIGKATCIELARRGVAVAVNYSRSRYEAEETVREIREEGGHAIAIQADVSQDHEVRLMMERMDEAFGRIDWLVNNAGATRYIPFSELESVTEDAWDQLFGVNVKGTFHCSRAAAPYMKINSQGAIVNLGSIAGSTGLGSSIPYAVSKAAVHGLTKSLAHTLAPDIRVNCVVPGAVETRWWDGREEMMKKLAPNLLLKRLATPTDIARLICSALEQEAMTGQIITVDSGQTL